MSAPPKDAETPPAKKGGKLKLVGIVVALLGAAGGGAYGAHAMGLFGGAGAGEHQPDVPKLVRKGDEDPYAPESKDKDTPTEIDGEGGSEYRTSYYSFEDSFTSNLRESPALIQISIAASTHYDGRVIRWMAKHDLALRSRILIELADTPEDDAYTPEGRERIAKRLTKAINEKLTEAEGFGGVDDVYFREFLVQ